MSKSLIKPGSASLRFWQLLLLVVILGVWHLASRDPKVAFFFGEPLKVWGRIWAWFVTNADIYTHLWVTLTETVLAFFIGTAAGLGAGLWLGLSPLASAILDPYIKAANSMPRVILAPIFGMWFGLGIWSKVALAVTLVFFIVFFNVYQGVREVSPTLLDNARMLGARRRQLLRHVYLPSATSWVFSSLHTSVGLAFVGAVVGEYLFGQRRGLPDPAGRGHFRCEHRVRGHRGADGVRAGAGLHGRPEREAPDEVAAQVGRNRKI